MSAKAWALAIRPKTLSAGMCPVLLGSSFAFSIYFNYSVFLLTLLFALFIQIGTNLANDYFDFVKGTDTEDRVGPARACQMGWITPKHMKWGFIFAFFLAACMAFPLILIGGQVAITIALLSILFGVLYTGGPYPLGYIGLGDIFVLLFFGPIAVGGTYFLQTGIIPLSIFIAGLGPGLISCAILTVNNVRDYIGDKKTGKQTLVVRFGKTFGKWEYAFCMVLASALPLFFIPRPLNAILACASSLIFSLPLIQTIFKTEDAKTLNLLLAKTAKFLTLYTLQFAIFIALS